VGPPPGESPGKMRMDPFYRALSLSSKERAAADTDLGLLHAGVRLGMLLPRFHACAHLSALPLPPHAPTPLLLAVVQGSSFLLSAALLACKRAALQAALAQGGTLAALEGACAQAGAVPPLPICIAEGAAARPLAPAELRAWLACQAALLGALLEGAPPWEARGRHGCHGALELLAPADGAPAAYCPVALAGVLLDYPIVYDLQGARGHCLDGCALSVWRAGPFAFSIPLALAGDAAARAAIAQWRALLAARAAEAGVVPLDCSCTTESRTHYVC
jgi:hypothetical protein